MSFLTIFPSFRTFHKWLILINFRSVFTCRMSFANRIWKSTQTQKVWCRCPHLICTIQPFVWAIVVWCDALRTQQVHFNCSSMHRRRPSKWQRNLCRPQIQTEAKHLRATRMAIITTINRISSNRIIIVIIIYWIIKIITPAAIWPVSIARTPMQAVKRIRFCRKAIWPATWPTYRACWMNWTWTICISHRWRSDGPRLRRRRSPPCHMLNRKAAPMMWWHWDRTWRRAHRAMLACTVSLQHRWKKCLRHFNRSKWRRASIAAVTSVWMSRKCRSTARRDSSRVVSTKAKRVALSSSHRKSCHTTVWMRCLQPQHPASVLRRFDGHRSCHPKASCRQRSSSTSTCSESNTAVRKVSFFFLRNLPSAEHLSINL